MSNHLDAMRAFWSRFTTVGLYECGYADFAAQSGATLATTNRDMMRACAYLHGAADMARLASPYMGREWRIAHLMAIAAGTLGVMCDEACDAANTSLVNVMAERVIHTYVNELTELAKRERAA